MRLKTQGTAQIPIAERSLLLRCLTKVGIALESKPGNQLSSQVDLGYTELFHVAALAEDPFRTVTVFLGTLRSDIKEVKGPFMFDVEHGIALHAMQGNQASSHGEGEVLWFFSSCTRNLGIFLSYDRDGPSEFVFVQ